MRSSEFVAIRPYLQRAVDAINESFEQERQSREIAAEFEKEFQRRAALPEGTAPKTELESPSEEQYRKDVRAILGPPPKHEGAMQQYLIREELLMRHPQITPRRIENAYLWRHSAARAAEELADCRWTKEGREIAEELNGLPKQTDPIDWEQPGARDRQLEAIRAAAERIREILTTCLEKQAPEVETGPPVEIQHGSGSGGDRGKQGQTVKTEPPIELLAALTPKQQRILCCLWTPLVVDRDELLREVWEKRTPAEATVEKAVYLLRDKLCRLRTDSKLRQYSEIGIKITKTHVVLRRPDKTPDKTPDK